MFLAHLASSEPANHACDLGSLAPKMEMDRRSDPLRKRRKNAPVLHAFVEDDQRLCPRLVQRLGDFLGRERGKKPDFQQSDSWDPFFALEVTCCHLAGTGGLSQ